MSEGVILWSTGTSRTNGERGDSMTEEELREIPHYARVINSHIQQLIYLRQAAESIPPLSTDEKVQTSMVSHNTTADTMIDLETQIHQELRDLHEMQAEARGMFVKADLDFDEKVVVKYRYLYCLRWEDIAESMHMSERSVRRHHAFAIRKIFPAC